MFSPSSYYHSAREHFGFLILEHDPLLYEDYQEMAGLADRVFCIYNKPTGAKGRGKVEARMTGEQRTLEAYSLGGPGSGHRPGQSRPGGRSAATVKVRPWSSRRLWRSWRRYSAPGPEMRRR